MHKHHRFVHIWKKRDVQALDWCPCAVILRLQFQILISYKQPKRMVPMWDALEFYFCTLPEVSGMGDNGVKRRTI
jgi:hypothetical protein